MLVAAVGGAWLPTHRPSDWAILELTNRWLVERERPVDRWAARNEGPGWREDKPPSIGRDTEREGRRKGGRDGGTPHTAGSPHQRRPTVCVRVCVSVCECHNVVRRNALVFAAGRPLNTGGAERKCREEEQRKRIKRAKRNCFHMVIRSPAGKTEDRRLRCYNIRKISF